MAQASWQGAKICYFQRSYEAPALFVLFQMVYAQGIESLKTAALGAGVTEDMWQQMLVYSAAVY